MKIPLDSRISWAALLLFFEQGAIIAASSYTDFGLVSIYEPGIFAYFFLAQGLISALLIGLSLVLMRRHPKAIS